MKTLDELKAELHALEAEVETISREGRVLMDCWIAQAKPGSKKNKYPRLKSRRPIFDGKKTEYLSIHGSALEDAEAAIARGKAIKSLNKRIKALSDRLEKLQKKSTQASDGVSKLPQERYTPPAYIALARRVMGEIDLDPAGDDVSQQWVRATSCYTTADDGLSQPWCGRVWLHPPAAGKTGKWVRKAIAERDAGQLTEGILLVKPSPGSKWFQKLTRQFPVCFPDECIKFLDAQGTPQTKSKPGHVFFYLGDNVNQFKQVFSEIGSVSSPI